jgi:hypothetical protein
MNGNLERLIIDLEREIPTGFAEVKERLDRIDGKLAQIEATLENVIPPRWLK